MATPEACSFDCDWILPAPNPCGACPHAMARRTGRPFEAALDRSIRRELARRQAAKEAPVEVDQAR